MGKKATFILAFVMAVLISQQPSLGLANSEQWGRAQNGIRTRLIGLEKEYVVGQPMRFRLEMINESKVVKNYDSQQVKVNNSMIIKDSNGNIILYSDEYYMTTGYPAPIQPGETVILFDNFDITSQYKISNPGQYTIQFRGQDQAFGDVSIPPSNVISIEVG